MLQDTEVLATLWDLGFFTRPPAPAPASFLAIPDTLQLGLPDLSTTVTHGITVSKPGGRLMPLSQMSALVQDLHHARGQVKDLASTPSNLLPPWSDMTNTTDLIFKINLCYSGQHGGAQRADGGVQRPARRRSALKNAPSTSTFSASTFSISTSSISTSFLPSWSEPA
jgi:hypothetical protein